MDKKGKLLFAEDEGMFALFVVLSILSLVLLLILTALLLKLTIRIRIVYGPKEKSFRWQMSLLKLYHREYDFFPRDTIQKQVNERGRESVVELAQHLLRHMSFWQVDAYALLGTGDAAATAICCGVVDAAFNAVASILLPKGKKGRGWLMRTTPAFDSKALEAQIHGIFRIRLVQIIRAALRWRKEKDREKKA